MKTKLLSLLVAGLLLISLTPVLGTETGTGIDIDIEPEEFGVMIWMCNNRLVLEDCVEEGRISDCTDGLVERTQNYAFEGEQIGMTVLVMDKNKIEEVQEVVATIGRTQGTGNDVETECQRRTVRDGVLIPDFCEARILEEELDTFDANTMAVYDCLFTVETPESMQGEFFLTIEAISVDSEATIDENEFWFFNPIIALTVDGNVEFESVRPGSVAYSSTILVGNDAEAGSGVLLDMFISGTDFYDPDDSGARCPDTNQLQLSNSIRSPSNIGSTGGASDLDGGGPLGSGTGFSGPHKELACEAGTDGITSDTNADHLCYYATNGAYSTVTAPNADAEGYVPIVYGDTFVRDFYNDAEIIRVGAVGPLPGTYHPGNILSPGAEIALNFKLGLPEPCVGNFNEGDIFFWGEAV